MNNQELERIELYAEGKLSPEEENALEQRMRNDGPYREWVNETLMLIKGVKQYGRAAFMTELKQWEKKAGKPAYLIPVIPRIYYYAAAVALLLVASVFTYRLFNKTQTSQQLYATYFKPYPNVVMPMTREENRANPFADAFRLYEAGKYRDALAQFGQIADRSEDENILFYSAMSFLALGEADSAIVILEPLKGTNSHFRQQIYWYLALCYLKKDDPVSAGINLDSLLKEYPGHHYGNALLPFINQLKTNKHEHYKSLPDQHRNADH